MMYNGLFDDVFFVCVIRSGCWGLFGIFFFFVFFLSLILWLFNTPFAVADAK